jgi:hypothetical protein
MMKFNTEFQQRSSPDKSPQERVMRTTISGLIAALAVIAAGVAPASACDNCSPCGSVSPCAQGYVQPYASYERLADPEVQYHHPVAPPQYYYVQQVPTYNGPGDFAPHRVYREEGIYGSYGPRRHHHHRRHYQHVLHSYY